jgi:hypothetical protein
MHHLDRLYLAALWSYILTFHLTLFALTITDFTHAHLNFLQEQLLL